MPAASTKQPRQDPPDPASLVQRFLPPDRAFYACVAALTLGFAFPLIRLVGFALQSNLYSHIVLIPVASVGMVWIRRRSLPAVGGCAVVSTIVLALAAIASLTYSMTATPAVALEPHHQLTWTTASYVLFVIAAGCWFLGGAFMRAIIVPAAFLGFMIPMPGWMERGIETALQLASAEATHVLFSLAGTPFLRDGQIFRLPSITMEIAQECSGIHSSLVLFITSIVAGQMFLRPGWRSWTLTLAVIPLAIVRNGFRVFVLGQLCERIGPHMIHHWIHHHGGPIFFVLSLIPFFIMLIFLARWRTRRAPVRDQREEGRGQQTQ